MTENANTRETASMQISSLFIYPVKSCAGLSLPALEIEERGPRHDREWMIVDENNRFLSQRQLPRMALIQPTLSTQHLTLAAPGQESLQIPLQISRAHSPDVLATRDRQVIVWNDSCHGLDEGDPAAAWLSSFLGCKARLVRMAPQHQRLVDPRYAPTGVTTRFSDGFPLLLISEGSLAGLNQRLSQPVPMNRFRPNIVVSGCEPHAEDTWRSIRVGPSLELLVVKPCSRCTITTVDQKTGVANKEPLLTLSRYRRFDNKVMFGQNLVHRSTGTLRIHDKLEILTSGPGLTSP